LHKTTSCPIIKPTFMRTEMSSQHESKRNFRKKVIGVIAAATLAIPGAYAVGDFALASILAPKNLTTEQLQELHRRQERDAHFLEGIGAVAAVGAVGFGLLTNRGLSRASEDISSRREVTKQ
jgi:hypothetical protein